MAEMETGEGWNSCKNTKKGGGGGGEQGFCNDYVYRISTAEEWAELQTSGSTFGRQIDKSTGCIHLSNLHQVRLTGNSMCLYRLPFLFACFH